MTKAQNLPLSLPAAPPQAAQQIDKEQFSLFMEELVVLAAKHGFGIVAQTKLEQEPYAAQVAHVGFLQMLDTQEVVVNESMRAQIRGSFTAKEGPTLELKSTTTLAEIVEQFQQSQQASAARVQDIRGLLRAMALGLTQDAHGS